MTELDLKCVNTIRILAAEGVQAANSGHPGLPMGSAPMAYTLWSRHLHHNPADPKWVNRDRFVLSAGHGSMLMYSLLHLFGYGITVDDLKNFRQLGSRTPGHPEYGHTVGVETTTGPLGQGIANAVGFAMAEARLAAEFNRDGFPVVDHYTYALCGDGCLMEGISGEASSLAGTLGLGKLIVLYDDNDISIEGNTDIAFTEDVPARYRAYGWHVQIVEDGNDVDAIDKALTAARAEMARPSLIVVRTQIGYGCPAKQGKASAHGEPLGADNLIATKENLGWPLEPAFYVPEEVREAMAKRAQELAAEEERWNALFGSYCESFPEMKERWDLFFGDKLPDLWNDEDLFTFTKPDATRNTSGQVLNKLAKKIPNFFGGSADLSPSNKSDMKGVPYFSKDDRTGSNIHFGVREHAMSAICNGIALHGGLRPYCATFFVFSDYMKHGMRLASLMKLKMPYILTHDSIGVGEDGPTHQPIEHLAGLRSLPGMTVYRPADGVETACAWIYALEHQGPVSLVLTRQNLPQYGEKAKNARFGAYVLEDSEKETPDVILMASGSEVELALKAREVLKGRGVDARVVSMPSWEVFEAQSAEYKESVLPNRVRARLAIEAAAPFGWGKYVGLDGDVLAMEGFGASGPAAKLFEHFGFTAENAADKAEALVKR